MRRKDLSEKKWAVLEDLFYSALDENAVLQKHNVTRTTYERWLRQKLFSRQFQQYTASLARRTALAVAKAETEVAVRLVELTRCQKEESARKACQNVLAIANRFFETVARINEGTLEENRENFGGNRGDFGGKRGENGGNRGVFGENRGSFGECRDIFGLNQGACSSNHNHPAHNHTRPEITPEQASKILAILAEDDDEKQEEEQRRIKNNEGEKTKISV
jgi:hypothetical protein